MAQHSIRCAERSCQWAQQVAKAVDHLGRRPLEEVAALLRIATAAEEPLAARAGLLGDPQRRHRRLGAPTRREGAISPHEVLARLVRVRVRVRDLDSVRFRFQFRFWFRVWVCVRVRVLARLVPAAHEEPTEARAGLAHPAQCDQPRAVQLADPANAVRTPRRRRQRRRCSMLQHGRGRQLWRRCLRRCLRQCLRRRQLQPWRGRCLES